MAIRKIEFPCTEKSGGNIRNELHFQQCYMILKLELAFFQTPQLKLVVQDIAGQKIDDRIQIAMFYLQLDDSSLYIFQWNHDL